MKSVVFKKICIQNFISIGETPVEFFYQPGVNLVTGHNHDANSRNGIGKSAVFGDALFFALFGQTLRPINKPMIANRQTDGRCRVELEFDVTTSDCTDHYNLVRTLKPSKLYLTKNGEDISLNINRSTEEINKIINASPEVFRNCVIMSLNNTLPFMLQSKVDKRKFIEGILRLDIFSQMLLSVRRLINDQTREADVKHAIHTEKIRNVDACKEQQRKQSQLRRKQIQDLQQRIAQNNAKVDVLLKTINEANTIDIDQTRDNMTKLQGQLDKSNVDVQDLIRRQAGLSERAKALLRDIRAIESKPKNCPMCKRTYEDHNQQQLADELQQLSVQKTEIDDQLSQTADDLKQQSTLAKRCQQAINRLNSNIEQWRQHESLRQTCDIQVNQLKEFNAHSESDIQNLMDSRDQLSEVIENAQQQVAIARQQLESTQFILDALETCRFVVSEEGVKSYIIKKMLKMFNSRLAYYLTKLNANCRCTFNEYFEETILDDHNNEVSYSNFSGGESKRIDLAMLFTFQDIRRLQADSSVNVCVYDELFDSSLDQSGVAAVLDLLKERAQKLNGSTYVITHRSESLKMVDDVNIVHLEKRNGITQIAQVETAL